MCIFLTSVIGKIVPLKPWKKKNKNDQYTEMSHVSLVLPDLDERQI